MDYSHTSTPAHADPFSSPGAQRPVSFSDRVRHSKALIPTLAVLLVAVLGLAATLVANRSNALAGGGYAEQAAPQTAPVFSSTPLNAPVAAAPVVRPAPVKRAAPEPRYAAAAPVCTTCGVVESVSTVQRAAPASGVGMVAGGVAGALLGNQVGGGNGRTAMTVLGAVGGGYAGNAVEKNMKKTTAYQMRIRMEDGSVRTIEHASPIAAGSRVIVEGNAVRIA